MNLKGAQAVVTGAGRWRPIFDTPAEEAAAMMAVQALQWGRIWIAMGRG